jgi:multidrug efflux system membrane fusion protein
MKPILKIVLVAAVIAGGGYYGWKTFAPKGDAVPAKAAKGEGKAEGKGGRRGPSGPLNVRTITVAPQAMPMVIDAVGTVESENSVAVRAQISGALQAVMFKEGDYVKQGQVLFRIDPRSAQASVEQANAAVERDRAQLMQAQAQEARLRPLMEKDYVTRQEYDVAATQVKSLESTVNANRAALDQAKLLMSYSQVVAPISGRTGSLAVTTGNLVNAGGAEPLVVINSTRPILVTMSVPQRRLEDVRRYWNTRDLKVQVSANPGGPTVAEGALIFIDNTVNVTTGTITLKARVKNEHEELWPGQFIAARIILKVDKDALALPESAVQPGQEKPFVYLVRDGKAVMQIVKVARQVGDKVVIAEGISEGDQVIVNVPFALTNGAPVVVQGAGKDAAPDSDKKAAAEGDAKKSDGEAKK